MTTEYELQRKKNIAANLAILASLGLEKPAASKQIRLEPKPKPKSNNPLKINKKRFGKKRKATHNNDVRGVVEQRTGGGGSLTDFDGRRKSARISSRRVVTRSDTTSSSSSLFNGLDRFEDDEEDEEEEDEEREKSKIWRSNFGIKGLKNKPDNKIYGHISGVEVNSWWSTRMECSNAGVHAPWVAGISGDTQNGAWSIAISGGYEDDIDEGFRFTFTGEGGRNLKGTKQNPKNLRTGPQAKDQVLERGNLSLKRSCETGNPVRVIRGFKGDRKWAPKTGYRYDGLYQVLKWWEDTGLSGYKVYKFAFKRIDGQPPIDLTAGGPADDENDEEVEVDGEDSEEAVRTEVEKD